MIAAAQLRCRTFELEALPHLDTVYRVALSLAGDADRADDLVQDTMLKAYKSWHQYQPGTNVRAWLLTILRNTYISDHRRRKLHGHTEDVIEIEDRTVFDSVEYWDPEGSFFHNLVDDDVRQAIHALPDEFRQTLVLRDIEGLRYDEIAQITGVAVGTVKSRLFRARKFLQQRLYDYAVEMGYVRPTVGVQHAPDG